MHKASYPDWYHKTLSDEERKLYRKLARYTRAQLISVLDQNNHMQHIDMSGIFSQCTKNDLIQYALTYKLCGKSSFDVELH